MSTAAHYVGEELPTFAAARNWKGYVRSILTDSLRGSVLEVGAGLGTTTEALCNDDVERWLCLEPDASLAAQCEARLGNRLGRTAVETRVGTVEVLASTEKFDAIVYIDVLEHIEHDAAELARAAKHLKPGGALIVLSPANQWLFSEFDHAVGHFRRYSRSTLAAAFPPALRRERILYADSLGALLSLGNRYVLHRAAPAKEQILFWDRVVVPISRVVDRVLMQSIGRSVIAIYRQPGASRA